MTISKRQSELLQQLKEHQTMLTADSLSKALGVSSKTVRNDIRQINTAFQPPVIESKAGKGYFLNDVNHQLDKLLTEAEPQNLQFEVLNRIIDAQKTDFYELADEFYMSESTLDRMIKALNRVIAERDETLCIVRRHNQLLIEGEEEQKRQIFNIFLNQEIENHKLSLDKYADYFEFCDLKALSRLIITYHKENHFSMNDFSTISFILHVAVLIERISKGSYVQADRLRQSDEKSRLLAEQFAQELQKKMAITIPPQEMYYIARLYSGKFILAEQTNEHQFTEIVQQLLESVAFNFHIDFSADERMKDYLVTHLSALYKRSVQKQYLTNPLTEEMKNKFPFIYNVSVYAAAFIQKTLDVTFPDDEIAYIALHFLSASENISYGKKRKLLLICPYGAASRRLVRNKLKKMTKYSIELLELSSVFDLETAEMEDVDLVVTTEELTLPKKLPVYQYGTFFSDEDVKKIQLRLDELQDSESILHKFFKEELFFPAQSFKTREEVIRFLCRNLTNLGYCEADYEERVLSREQLSSTSYGNYYAIPHAIQRSALKNAVTVCCLDKPIDWGGNRVRLVLLLALKEERDTSFEELFSQLVKILDEGSFVRKLSKQTNFEAFIELCR
ncbi:BglG family transcription antiterminator [Enterococcus sp. LJL128]|uniref:BglG family transcription antiterminator n=1 Tax=Enterococcus sp. LJL51 TaxID=3416656 RepID=UPI003CF2C17D